MRVLLFSSSLLSLMLSGAIFGFFYAWVCSTMWGLDAADPRVAIPAMQAMNASVRNAVFAPAFFATPFVLFVTALLARAANQSLAMLSFGVAGLAYLFGGLILTMMVNIPMNEALAAVVVPPTLPEAEAVWAAYSPAWQDWNTVRTLVAGLTLLLTGTCIATLRPATQRGF